jgi:hypothetical protein
LEWKSNITLDKGQKLIVCAKKSALKANTLYPESQPPDTPKNRDAMKAGILPNGDTKRRKSRRQDPLRSSGEYLSLWLRSNCIGAYRPTRRDPTWWWCGAAKGTWSWRGIPSLPNVECAGGITSSSLVGSNHLARLRTSAVWPRRHASWLLGS